MIRQVVKNELLLKQKSIPATKEDLYIVKDLIDTLNANKEHCIGMAANMIGYNKTILVASLGILTLTMINPKIIKKDKEYVTTEGCLSLVGERQTKRYEEIEVEYLDETFTKKKSKYTGLLAEIIQHEIDHFEGRII